jgi:mannose-1-phosphate guanylyltransferase
MTFSPHPTPAQASSFPFYPVILAGGSGERFWPLSRRYRPKQFLSLDDSGRTLIQATFDRLLHLSGDSDNIVVVTGNEHRMQVLEQLPDILLENMLIEPVGRDTAPAVLYAALHIARETPDAVMGIFPADHRVGDLSAFQRVLGQAIEVAGHQRQLVTLGIEPTFAATGYGYIQRGALLEEQATCGAFGPLLPTYGVTRFTEKPDVSTAEGFLRSGDYFWNSGMFVWSVDVILRAFERHQPELYALLNAAVNAGYRSRTAIKQVFPALQKISIDYAIMEKADGVAVIPAEFSWDDLGDWNALERLFRGEGQNVAVGRHVGLDTSGAILYTTNGDDLIATIGLDDIVVVRADEVTLVVRKDRTQDIKKIVEQLKARPENARFT